MKLPLILSLILSISVIVAIFILTFNSNTIQTLTDQRLRYEFFLVAFAISILFWFIWGIRLKILSNSINKSVKVSTWESTKIIIANLFLANITPSLAGGEPVRIYLLSKNGLSVGEATAAVLGERLLDVIFLLLCFPFAFFILRDLIDIEALRIGLIIAIAVFIMVVFVFLYAIKNPDKTKSFLIFIVNKFKRFFKKKDSQKQILTRINREVDNFSNSMNYFLTSGRIAFLKAGLLTAVLWLTGWMIPSLILMGLNISPYFLQSYAAQILLIIIVMMPTTPGSAGVTEGGAAALYGIFVDSSLIGVFILMFRLLTYHLGLIAGAIFQYKIFKSVTSFSLDSIKK